MEIREYWDIVWRRAWIVVCLTVLAFAASWMASASLTASYQATMRVAVKPQLVEPRPNSFYTYDEYYAYAASEFLVDDIIEIIESRAFGEELLSRLSGKMAGVSGVAIDGKKMHRVLIVNVTSSSPETAQLAAETIGQLLTEPDNKYFANLSWHNPVANVVDPPRTVQIGESRKFLDIGLRTVLGLIAGIGLAFLLDYLDGSVTKAQQAERLIGLPVLGEIPRQKKGFLRR